MLHLDWLDYGERLLGPADWTDAARVAGLYGKLQALLSSDLIALPVARVAAAHIEARAGLLRLITSKPAGAQPLRALLADGTLRTMIGETLTRLDGVRGGATLALQMPAPAEFAQAVAIAAGLAAPAADEDLADDAAVYLADFIRAFATSPVKALVLGQDAFTEFDAPVVKVAVHYGWQVIRPCDVATGLVPPDTRPEDAAALVAGLRSKDPA